MPPPAGIDLLYTNKCVFRHIYTSLMYMKCVYDRKANENFFGVKSLVIIKELYVWGRARKNEMKIIWIYSTYTEK